MKFAKWMVPALATAISLGFCSCSSDDDDDPDYTGNGPTLVDPSTGADVLLYSVGKDSYHYDSQNRLVAILEGKDTEALIDWSKMTITDDDGLVWNFRVNDSGYITEMWTSGNYARDNQTVTVKGNLKYQYDSAGHLIAYSGSSVTSYLQSASGAITTETADLSAEISWSNGSLQAFNYQEDGQDEGRSYSETYQATYSYPATVVSNPLRQMTLGSALILSSEPQTSLAMAGLFGVGSELLPSAVTYAETESEQGEAPEYKSGTYNLTYTVNGGVRSETVNGTTYSYSYTAAASR